MALPIPDKSILQDSYISGVITSFLTIFIIEIWRYLSKSLVNRRFKAVFSKKDSRLNLIVPGFYIRPDLIEHATNANFPSPTLPLIKQSGSFYRSSKLIGNCEVKALKYISDEISNRLKYSPQLRLDDDLAKSLDLDFVSFGGSNFYCQQIFNDSANNFFVFENSHTIISKISGKRFESNSQFDYGIVIKLKNYNFPERIWIAIAGINETGTSGSGWYLAKYWEKIQRGAGSSEFAFIVQVQKGVDHSARVIESYYRPGTEVYKLYI